jgi:hypothetical protein
MQRNYSEEIFFDEHKRFFGFFLNHLEDKASVGQQQAAQ